MDENVAEWTQANLLKLLAGIKSSIGDGDRKRIYTQTLKAMDWNQVAFPPFSPEECQRKLSDILHKLSKTRTLTELLDVAEEVVSNPVKNKKAHPELPKRPGPPNALFFQEQRAEYQKKHPKLSQQMVLKKLARKYNKLPAEEKVKYLEKHKQAVTDYKGAMQVFSDRCKHKSNHCRTRDPKSAESTDGVPPKPALSGYHLFLKEECSSGGSSLTLCAERWRAMSDEEKEKYNKCHRVLQGQYLDEMKQYLMDFGKEKQQKILKENRILKAMTNQRFKKLFPGEPTMPDRTGRRIFFKQQMVLLGKEIPDSRVRLCTVNKLWTNLPVVEKQPYKDQVPGEMMKYSTALQKWFMTLPKAQKLFYQRKKPKRVQYLDACQMPEFEEEEPHASSYRPSDSEDELTEDSSDEELDEVEEEEEDEVISFEVY
ncbi:nucleolar transcription factor 1-B isoform 1-T1 [Spinachia spinachia]